MYPNYSNYPNNVNYAPGYSNPMNNNLYNSNLRSNNNNDRLGGFAVPFILGGITGGLVAPYFYRPMYYYPPYYGPYYR